MSYNPYGGKFASPLSPAALPQLANYLNKQHHHMADRQDLARFQVKATQRLAWDRLQEWVCRSQSSKGNIADFSL